MSFLFFFASLVSAAVAAEAVRRRRNVREATKVGAVLFAVLSLCGSAWMGTDAAVGCAAAVCVLSVGTLLELAHRVPSEAVWLTASLSVGLGVAAPIFALAVLAAVLLRNTRNCCCSGLSGVGSSRFRRRSKSGECSLS